jgi:transposase
MIIVPTGARVHVALGMTDMRNGMCGLSMMVQKVLAKDPFSGHLFVFRGRRANYIKILYWDGNGLCLFSKRLERGRFAWPATTEVGGTLALTPAQLSMLIEGIDWRSPERTWRPELAG